MLERLRGLLIGGRKNLFDPQIHHQLALIAFFAWVGLGSDGLSSSSYGPEEAFLALGQHTHLALYLTVATVLTVFLISASYSQIIELFPSGGGGYLVATKLLGEGPGVVSGSALVVGAPHSEVALGPFLGEGGAGDGRDDGCDDGESGHGSLFSTSRARAPHSGGPSRLR